MIRFKQQHRINNPHGISIFCIHNMMIYVLLLDSTHYKIFFNNMIVFLKEIIRNTIFYHQSGFILATHTRFKPEVSLKSYHRTHSVPPYKIFCGLPFPRPFSTGSTKPFIFHLPLPQRSNKVTEFLFT
uniref:Uncharacterized protein n=1 Tax=Solanum lycopersicum TaxID=4081 RepID=A0A3Q7FIC8_SOLLC